MEPSSASARAKSKSVSASSRIRSTPGKLRPGSMKSARQTALASGSSLRPGGVEPYGLQNAGVVDAELPRRQHGPDRRGGAPRRRPPLSPSTSSANRRRLSASRSLATSWSSPAQAHANSSAPCLLASIVAATPRPGRAGLPSGRHVLSLSLSRGAPLPAQAAAGHTPTRSVVP